MKGGVYAHRQKPCFEPRKGHLVRLKGRFEKGGVRQTGTRRHQSGSGFGIGQVRVSSCGTSSVGSENATPTKSNFGCSSVTCNRPTVIRRRPVSIFQTFIYDCFFLFRKTHFPDYPFLSVYGSVEKRPKSVDRLIRRRLRERAALTQPPLTSVQAKSPYPKITICERAIWYFANSTFSSESNGSPHSPFFKSHSALALCLSA